MKRIIGVVSTSVRLAICAALAGGVMSAGADGERAARPGDKPQVKHLVVIYMENHSFDNLYGKWAPVNGEPVNGLDRAARARTAQAGQNGSAFKCLLQNDPHLATPPLAANCTDTNPVSGTPFSSAFGNAPFAIDPYIPNSSPTEDLVHRFYQEQYQIDHGRQDRYVTGSNAVGLSMGYYDTTKLPFYQYLHTAGAPNYIVLDNFFQAAFGGSFLNHQWLVAAETPVFANAPNDASSADLHSVVDQNGMPVHTSNGYPLYASPLGTAAKDGALTASCAPPAGRPATPTNVVCGDYVINTVQPFAQPYAPGTADAKRLPPLYTTNIGDELSQKGVDWAWYSGGWSNAAGKVGAPGWTNGSNGTSCTDADVIAGATYPYCPDKLFQFHHQAFNYFGAYAPGKAARDQHLLDEAEFIAAASSGSLKPVSFVKPIGEENEHPGYASVAAGSQHLVDLVKAIESGPNAADTLVIITYDEFGGAWDHVPPPGQGDTRGVHDRFGPGTRIPAIVISRAIPRATVDHTQYDTTSILATIERRFGLDPLSGRDAQVNDLLDLEHPHGSH